MSTADPISLTQAKRYAANADTILLRATPASRRRPPSGISVDDDVAVAVIGAPVGAGPAQAEARIAVARVSRSRIERCLLGVERRPPRRSGRR